MSLLLEALKKAEKAKEEAQRRERAESPSSAANELRLQDDPPAAPAAEGKPVTTRAELPDISQPLEILTDDIAAPKPGAPRPAPRAAPRPSASSAPRAQAAPRDASDASAGRASAKKVFEAKFKEPNPKLPFYATLGVLGVAILGTVIYFWIQLRPAPSLVTANPKAPAAENPVAAAPAVPPVSAQPLSSTQAIPGLPSAAAQAAAPAAAAPITPPPAPRAPSPTPAVPRPSASPAELVARSNAASRQPARPAQPALRPAEPAAAPARPLMQVNPQVESGYNAFVAGDLVKARAAYEQALRDEPGNRDALLGLAAIDVRSGLYEAAEARYLALLRADPRDANAQAGLIALRGGRMDPQVAESRVKTMIATDPQAHVLHFTLGNQLAQQGRWAEAQQEFFKAYAAEPDNPDFAYNLAVSLDHLRQPKVAREYYQRAVTLAGTRGASFDPASARARIAQLGH